MRVICSSSSVCALLALSFELEVAFMRDARCEMAARTHTGTQRTAHAACCNTQDNAYRTLHYPSPKLKVAGYLLSMSLSLKNGT